MSSSCLWLGMPSYSSSDIQSNMTERDKMNELIKLGYTADVENGVVYNIYQKPLISKNKNGYMTINRLGMRVYQHRFIWYIKNGCLPKQVDHIDRDRCNNKIQNLRDVSNQQNSFNRDAKGYCWHNPSSKWMAYICVDGRQIHLGLYDNEYDAKEAYIHAKKRHHIIV